MVLVNEGLLYCVLDCLMPQGSFFGGRRGWYISALGLKEAPDDNKPMTKVEAEIPASIGTKVLSFQDSTAVFGRATISVPLPTIAFILRGVQISMNMTDFSNITLAFEKTPELDLSKTTAKNILIDFIIKIK